MLVCGDLQLLHAGPRPGVASGHQYNGQLAQTLHNVIKIFEDVGANKEILKIENCHKCYYSACVRTEKKFDTILACF